MVGKSFVSCRSPSLEQRSEAELFLHDLGADLVPADVDTDADEADDDRQDRVVAPEGGRRSEEQQQGHDGPRAVHSRLVRCIVVHRYS